SSCIVGATWLYRSGAYRRMASRSCATLIRRDVAASLFGDFGDDAGADTTRIAPSVCAAGQSTCIVPVGRLIFDMRRGYRDPPRPLPRRLVDLVKRHKRCPAALRQHLGDGRRQRRLAMVDVRSSRCCYAASSAETSPSTWLSALLSKKTTPPRRACLPVTW